MLAVPLLLNLFRSLGSIRYIYVTALCARLSAESPGFDSLRDHYSGHEEFKMYLFIIGSL